MRTGPGRRTDEDAFEVWVGTALERADPFMAWLGVLFALLVGYELAVDLNASTVVWAVFTLELAAQLYLAPDRLRYLRRHPFERGAANPAFGSFGDAVLWGFSVVIAMQWDPAPSSTGASLAMLAGFLFGLVVVGAVAGTLGAFLLDDRREREGSA